MTKCFVQSMLLKNEPVSVEPRVVKKSIEWMVSKQSKDGSFPEPGKVFNKNMQVCRTSRDFLSTVINS